MTDDLAAFIEARLAEDEAVARGAFPGPGFALDGEWTAYEIFSGLQMVGTEAGESGEIGWRVCEVGQFDRAETVAGHIARHDPARVLRDIEAKRSTLRRCATRMNEPDQYPNGLVSARAVLARQTLMDMASTWRVHPDFRAEWAP